MSLKSAAFSVAVMLFSAALWAQQGQAPTPPAGGGQPGGTGGGAPSREPSTGTQPRPDPTQQPRFPTDDRSNDPFGRNSRGIQGKIIPSPTQRLRVDLYIDGIRLDTTYTDMDGSFRFERQQPGRRYEIHLDLGPGVEYVEEVDFSMNFPAMIHIREQGIKKTGPETGKGGGTMISIASLSVPKNARKEFEKGAKARQDKKLDEAAGHLQKAIEMYPKFAEAYNELGIVRRAQEKPEEAQKAFEQAISVDPSWLGAYISLANLQFSASKWDLVLETAGKALKLNPSLTPALYFTSVSNFMLQKMDDAEKAALEVDKAEHQNLPQIHLILAEIYKSKGNKNDALKQYSAFLKENPKAANRQRIEAEIATLKAQ